MVVSFTLFGVCDMYTLHTIETYAAWTMKQVEKQAMQAQRTDKKRFHYAYALGYACKALGVKHRDDSDAHDIAQSAFLLWHKSRTGKRVPLDTRAACRFAVRNYWRSKHIERIKGDTDNAINPNGKYANPIISTARKNNMSNVQTSDGIPDKMTRNLDLQTVDMEQTDTNVTTIVRMLSTGASQREIANQTDLSEMQVSRIVKRLRDMGKEYWGFRARGEAIPQPTFATIPRKSPKTFKPIKPVQCNEQTVLDNTPYRIAECERSPYWKQYAEYIRNNTDTNLRDTVEQYGYTENDMANPMPNDDDSVFKGEIIYS